MPTACLLVCSIILAHAARGEQVEATPFQQPPIQVVEGFEIELAAAPPLVRYPMMGGFDDQGRLYLAESSGENLSREELEAQLPNFIRRLEDTDGDGRFDRSTIFADRLTYPMGALWYQGALYVASSGAIWKFVDADDDGVAEHRQMLVSEFGYTGNAADVHGCFLGPCGRIYWCEGRHGHEIRDGRGDVTSQGKAARIFSCLPDGSDIRVHCGGGMDNPVEVDFTAAGEMLGTVNILYRQRGDCLVHWMHGGVYPRHDQPQVVAEFRRTGELLPPVIDLGHVAVSGTLRYRSGALDPAFKDDFFVTEFNTHKLTRVSLQRSGSTFTATSAEFLSSPSIDFHPTDVIEDADGSLLVIDTGGWFRRGCPTSQVAKPNIQGAIYRVRRRGMQPAADPRGLQLDWQSATVAELAQRLDDARFAVRERAVEALAAMGDAAVPALESAAAEGSPQLRQHVIWSAARVDTPAARNVVQRLLDDSDPDVRLAAAYAAGVRGHQAAEELLRARLTDDHAAVRREAATALGRLRAAEAVPSLCDLLRGETDVMLEHAVIYALIEINHPEALLSALDDPHPAVRRGALIALDQMPAQSLTAEQVARQLESGDPRLQQAAAQILSQHPQWSATAVDLLRQTLRGQGAEQPAALRGLLLAFAGDTALQAFIAEQAVAAETPAGLRRLLLEVIGQGGIDPFPDAWLSALRAGLQADQQEVVEQAVWSAGRISGSALRDDLHAIAADAERPQVLRAAAAAAVARQGGHLDDVLFELLAAPLRSKSASALDRLRSAQALSAALLSAQQQSQLFHWLADATPLELPALLSACHPLADPQLASQLLAALQQAGSLSSVAPQQIEEMITAWPAEFQEPGRRLLAELQGRDSDRALRLAALEAEMAGGDPQRGKQVFFDQRTACSSCHRIADQGAQLAPDLSKIGQRRGTRDLLEAIVYPSASLVRGFESVQIVTDGGQVLQGLIVRETPDSIVLRTVDQHEVRISTSSIEDMQPAAVSIMPAGLDRVMSVADLRDLVAYLLSL